MPKTVFGNGTEVSSAWFNAQQNLLFDGLDLDGHQPQLTDSALSNALGNLKPDWTTFKNAFSVTAGTGLSINVVGGIFTNSQDLPIAVASSGLAVSASSLSYVWISDSGVVTTGLSLPVIAFPIAAVTTSPSAITQIQDLRPRFKFGPQTRSIAVFGGRSSVDIVYSANATVDGVVNCRNFTLNAGSTITCATGFLKIVASGIVTINGAINIASPIGGGSSFNGGVVTPALLLADPGKGFGGGSGHNGLGGKSYPIDASIFGSGGASGLVYAPATSTSFGNATFTSSRGGSGGGSIIIEASGSILVAGSIVCNGDSAIAGTIISNTNSEVYLTGGGGGSGGSITLRSLTSSIVTAAGFLSARGGNGADARISNNIYLAVAGGGGGGGRVLIASPATNITGATITLTGGVAGSNAGTAGFGLAGSPGGGFGGIGGGSMGGVPASGTIGQLTLQSFITV